VPFESKEHLVTFVARPRDHFMKVKKYIIFICFISLSGYGFQEHLNIKKIADKIEEKIDCQDFEAFFWHALHDAALNFENPTSWGELRQSFQIRDRLRDEKVLAVIATLEKYLGEEFWRKTSKEQTEIWAQLELKIDDRPQWPELQAELTRLFSAHAKRKSLMCDREISLLSQVVDPSEKGGRWVMAAAYQSCEATRLPAMTLESPDAIGISRIGTHPSGGGVRVISDLKALQATHPYLRIQNKGAGCFDVEANPLIYDFGGKPGYVSSGDREIDLFIENGSGHDKTLGIDCSGLVFASLGVQGLRVIPNKDVTAGLVSGFSSASLLNPPKEWKCIERIKIGVGQGVNQGDVISIKGHTVLVDQIGADPFGLNLISNRTDCAKITSDNFDFTILQSSPNKGGVGINRYVVRDYLNDGADNMKSGLVKYARAACEARFDQKEVRPIYSDISIVRHKGSPECVGRGLTIKNESCISSCPEFASKMSASL
jgi:hypothetical protein